MGKYSSFDSKNRSVHLGLGRALLGREKLDEEGLPGGHNEPQERPRRRQKRPERPQDGAKSRQERAKSATRAAQEAPKRSFLLFLLLGRLREASGSDFGGILGSILGAPGTILERFWDDCGLDSKTD